MKIITILALSLFFLMGLSKIGDYDISGCCLMHDEAYEDFDKPRAEADDELRVCVNTVSHTKIGNIMFLGVRVFGWIFWYWYRLQLKKPKY